MAINTKYKIQQKDLKSTLEAIDRLGFEGAMSLALEGSLHIVKQEPEATLATTFLAWSHNLMLDARSCKRKGKKYKEFILLARFYRLLAHKIYWKQRLKEEIAPIADFLQAVE